MKFGRKGTYWGLDFDDDTPEDIKILLGKDDILETGGSTGNETEARHAAIEILDDPEVVAPAEYGGGTTYMRKGIGAVVPADEQRLVIAVFREGSGTSDRPRGGHGRRKASTFAELREMLQDHGFTVSMSGSHPKAQHPSHPAFITLPGTPSDARSFDNAIAEIHRRTGIDITRARSKS